MLVVVQIDIENNIWCNYSNNDHGTEENDLTIQIIQIYFENWLKENDK